ncbi:uncharacterized protein C8Q71DRAFT_862343 [Rhodofomes roseus]|uniref:Flavin reductase like domain-containing protein n=1 Tax=Rhodofomes roseus TaxID=34475 RepID=A0ABQ8K2Q2_9APHY|nr:uncharacterized protein C8Q71DRAFT_862343 [Rhodofomes roseus]KAH9830591.1 hypothetical protein C8Q71DRAFT_862343 [Rhodofomes roseus]
MAADIPPFNSSFEYRSTLSPNPQWTYGTKVADTPVGKAWLEGEKDGWKVVDTATEDKLKLYQLMISGIVPRPIAFVSTVSESGVENLAPFSWFNMVSHYPPLVSISCSDGPQRLKDTAGNIKATKAFTVNIISEPFVEAANVTSVDAPEGVSEWPISGLTKEKSIHVKPPRVKESAFSMECELFQTIDVADPESGAHTTTLILGHVKYIHVRKDILNERGNVDPAKLKPVGRMGDISYSRVGEGFRIARPVWANEQETIKKAIEREE